MPPEINRSSAPVNFSPDPMMSSLDGPQCLPEPEARPTPRANANVHDSFEPAAPRPHLQSKDEALFSPSGFAERNHDRETLRAGGALLQSNIEGAVKVTSRLLHGEIEVGKQTTARVGLSNVAWRSQDDRLDIAGDFLSGEIAAGEHNKDGSNGLNAGAMATAGGVEITRRFGSASSFTGGLSASVGAEASVGARDLDRDGDTEYCVRASLFFFTVGTCIEV